MKWLQILKLINRKDKKVMDILAIINDFDLDDEEILLLQDMMSQDEVDSIEW